MSQIHQFLNDLSKRSDAVKKTTRPLNHFGVTYFYYASIKNNGDHVLLTDCPHVDEYYYQEKIYQNDLYLRHPDHYQPGFFLFEYNQQKQFDEPLAYLERTLSIRPMIGLSERQKDGVEFFCFWGNPNNASQFENVYLNYGNLLKSFASHFKQNCSSILKDGVAPRLSLNELLGRELFKSKPLIKSKIDGEVLRRYLMDIGLGGLVVKSDALSKQEKECLKNLIHGNSAKETAAALRLSSRTVEHYIERIKNKLNCQNKKELFLVAEQLDGFNLI